MSTIDPVILFFLLGVAAGLGRADLRLPPAIYEFLSVVLLLTIGLKGGVELAQQAVLPLVPKLAVAVLMGAAIPIVLYPVLRRFGRFDRADAASIAAHYGSVSVGTYAVVAAYLTYRAIPFEQYMPVFVVLLEMPAILVGIVLARGVSRSTRWGLVLHEVLLGKGIVLLAGGLGIGWVAGPEGMAPLEPFFFDLFKGILALFLLEMGLIAAGQFGGLRRYGLFLLGFGVVTPLLLACAGTALGVAMGLSVGGTAVFATLAASASYIAVPAAMRLSVPEANPALSLAASLGITFPFNILLGIPLYTRLAEFAHQLGG